MSQQHPRNATTIIFVVILCGISALLLAVLATVLGPREQRAKELDQAKQILRSAEIFNAKGYFQLPADGGEYEPAKYDASKKMLVPGMEKATEDQIYAVYQARIQPMLTDDKGEVQSFKDAGIDPKDYIAEHQKEGYAKLPEKLFYLVSANDPSDEEPYAYILPLAGFGLWGPIYAYLALEPDADTVLGITWDAPMETPGLGAIIQEPQWQAQFDGKKIFLPSASGETNFESARLGIIVVKGKVSDVYGDSPRAETAVDGITGATLTGDGVTATFKDDLPYYRPFLVKMHEKSEKGS